MQEMGWLGRHRGEKGRSQEKVVVIYQQSFRSFQSIRHETVRIHLSVDDLVNTSTAILQYFLCLSLNIRLVYRHFGHLLIVCPFASGTQ